MTEALEKRGWWNVKFDIILEGKHIDFAKLSEITMGEICETVFETKGART